MLLAGTGKNGVGLAVWTRQAGGMFFNSTLTSIMPYLAINVSFGASSRRRIGSQGQRNPLLVQTMIS